MKLKCGYLENQFLRIGFVTAHDASGHSRVYQHGGMQTVIRSLCLCPEPASWEPAPV